MNIDRYVNVQNKIFMNLNLIYMGMHMSVLGNIIKIEKCVYISLCVYGMGVYW